MHILLYILWNVSFKNQVISTEWYRLKIYVWTLFINYPVSLSKYAVTSPDTVSNGYSVKIMLSKTPPQYFIVLASSVKTLEVKAIEFHWIDVLVCEKLRGGGLYTKNIVCKNVMLTIS